MVIFKDFKGSGNLIIPEVFTLKTIVELIIPVLLFVITKKGISKIKTWVVPVQWLTILKP